MLDLSARLRAAGLLRRVVNLRRGAPPSLEYDNGAGPFLLCSTLVRLLSGETLLHLHTNGHSWKSWTIIVCAASVLRLRRTPGVLTLHSGMCPGFLGGINAAGKSIVRWALASFAQIVSVNEEIRQAISRLGVPNHRLSVVPAFLGAAPGTLSEEHERTLKDYRPLLSVVTGPGPEYGLPMLIETLACLRARHPEVGCLILGHDGSDGPANMVRQLDLSNSAKFLGQLPHEQCLAFMARSDLFVRPSLADGDAISVREALSMGVPVVASDIGSRPAGVTLFRTGDSADLAEKVLAALRANRTPQLPANGPDFGDAILAVYEKATQHLKTRDGVTTSPRHGVRKLRRRP